MGEEKIEQTAMPVKPPYIAYKTLRNFLDGLKNAAVPSIIDRSVMPNSMSGSNRGLVIAALRYLDLIDDKGVPSELLEKLVHASDDDRPRLLQAILRESYSFLFSDDINIARATTRQVENKFKDLNLGIDTARKCILFFQSAAKDAKIVISPHIKPYQGMKKKNIRNTQFENEDNSEADEQGSGDKQQNTTHSHGTTKTINLKAGGSLTLSLKVNLLELGGEDRTFVFGLIDKLRTYEKGATGSTDEQAKVEKEAGE